MYALSAIRELISLVQSYTMLSSVPWQEKAKDAYMTRRLLAQWMVQHGLVDILLGYGQALHKFSGERKLCPPHLILFPPLHPPLHPRVERVFAQQWPAAPSILRVACRRDISLPRRRERAVRGESRVTLGCQFRFW